MLIQGAVEQGAAACDQEVQQCAVADALQRVVET